MRTNSNCSFRVIGSATKLKKCTTRLWTLLKQKGALLQGLICQIKAYTIEIEATATLAADMHIGDLSALKNDV